MFLATYPALDGDEQCRRLPRFLYWLMPQDVATHVVGNMLRYATLEEMLYKNRYEQQNRVLLLATIAATTTVTKMRETFVSGYVTLGNFLKQLVSQQNCKTSCTKHCLA